jgi:hypothetical protein
LSFSLPGIVQPPQSRRVALSQSLFELGVTAQFDPLVEAQKNLNEAIELYIESFGLENLPDISGASYWTGQP